MDLNSTSNEEVLRALKDLLDDRQITDAQYYKGVVGVAADYAKEGDIVSAYVTLAIPPPEYFELIQLRQMQDDPVYAEVAGGLAARLVRYGLDCDEELAPTQAPANA
jgi:hypothetical protein